MISKLISSNDQLSSMRAVVVFVVAIFVPPFVWVWTWLSLYHRSILDIPDGVLQLLLTLIGGKVAQTAIEVVAKKVMASTRTPLDAEEPKGTAGDSDGLSGTQKDQ